MIFSWARAIAIASVRWYMYMCLLKRRWKRIRIDATNTRASKGGWERTSANHTHERTMCWHIHEKRCSSSFVALSSKVLRDCSGQHVISVRQHPCPGQARGVQGLLLFRRRNRVRGEYAPMIPRLTKVSTYPRRGHRVFLLSTCDWYQIFIGTAFYRSSMSWICVSRIPFFISCGCHK